MRGRKTEMSLLESNFKASAVNMGKVSFDSTSTIKGMIFVPRYDEAV